MSARRVGWTLLGALAALLFVGALVGPWLAPHPVRASIGLPYEPPSAHALLGTDSVGRDVLSRLLAGGRRLVLIALLCTVAATGLGAIAGMTAALRPRLDGWVMRPIDALLALPAMLVLLLLGAGFGASTLVLVAAVCLTSAPFTARVARACTLDVVHRGYVEAALGRGERLPWLLGRELLPSVAGPLLADLGIRFVTAIYLVATAGFLGLGGSSERPDWGLQIQQEIGGAQDNPWAAAAPAIVLVALVTSVSLLLDGVYRARRERHA